MCVSYLRVIRGADTVHIPSNLCPQIRDDDELLEDILRENISETRLLDVV